MSRAFFDANAKAETLAAIKAIEAQTSAEVVVAVRPYSGSYRAADFLFGSLCAWAALVFLLFAPYPFAVASMPVDVVIVFLLGALVSARTTWLRLVLTRRSVRQRAVGTEARATFVELGIDKTQRRAGVLVFVSMLEKTVAIVPDVAVERASLGEAWKRARAELEGVLVPRAELPRFLGALRAMAPALAEGLPHREGDVNELPDEVA
jgi:putative membrane protein